MDINEALKDYEIRKTKLEEIRNRNQKILQDFSLYMKELKEEC